MNDQLRYKLVDAVHRRAIQLVKMTDRKRIANAPDVTIAFVAQNLVLTLCALLGESFLRFVLEAIFGEVSEKHGVCRFCREGAFVEAKGMCEKCFQQIEEEDREVVAQELMDSKAKGRVS